MANIINISEHMDKQLARCLCKMSYSHTHTFTHTHCQLIQVETSVLHSCWLLASPKKIIMQENWPVDIHKCPHVSSCKSFFPRFWPISAKSRYIFFFVGIWIMLEVQLLQHSLFPNGNIIRVMRIQNLFAT